MPTATKKYSTKVDKRSKRDMAQFLADHFRYDTMNSWNQVKSYAHNVKVNRFVPRELLDRAYDLLDVQETHDILTEIIREWDSESQNQWQAGFNGRSGGYLVLYEGGERPSEYKRICGSCFQKNYNAESTKCGRCGAETMRDYKGKDIFSWPGRGVDNEEDFDSFMEWSMSSLRARVQVIQRFDALCDTLAETFISLCEHNEVVEEVVMVPTTVRVLHEV